MISNFPDANRRSTKLSFEPRELSSSAPLHCGTQVCEPQNKLKLSPCLNRSPGFRARVREGVGVKVSVFCGFHKSSWLEGGWSLMLFAQQNTRRTPFVFCLWISTTRTNCLGECSAVGSALFHVVCKLDLLVLLFVSSNLRAVVLVSFARRQGRRRFPANSLSARKTPTICFVWPS